MTNTKDGAGEPSLPELHYIQYDPDKEAQYLTAIRELISKDLSEPYSIYVYRYFLYQWADLCYMVCIHLVFESWIRHTDFCSRQWIQQVN
jgi:peptide alpha-N-acetyltransferase